MININDEFQTAKQKGILHITAETDTYLVAKALDYNKQMAELRKKCDRVKYLKNEFLTGNPIAILLVIFYNTDEIVTYHASKYSFIISLVIFILYTAAYIYGVIKRDLLYCAAVSALLLFINFYFMFLLIPNVILYITIESIDRPLKKIKEYPIFSQIVIKKENYT